MSKLTQDERKVLELLNEYPDRYQTIVYLYEKAGLKNSRSLVEIMDAGYVDLWCFHSCAKLRITAAGQAALKEDSNATS